MASTIRVDSVEVGVPPGVRVDVRDGLVTLHFEEYTGSVSLRPPPLGKRSVGEEEEGESSVDGAKRARLETPADDSEPSSGAPRVAKAALALPSSQHAPKGLVGLIGDGVARGTDLTGCVEVRGERLPVDGNGTRLDKRSHSCPPIAGGGAQGSEVAQQQDATIRRGLDGVHEPVDQPLAPRRVGWVIACFEQGGDERGRVGGGGGLRHANAGAKGGSLSFDSA